MDSQGEDYQYPFTLPSQSQLEDNLKSKLTIHESIQEKMKFGFLYKKDNSICFFWGGSTFPLLNILFSSLI